MPPCGGLRFSVEEGSQIADRYTVPAYTDMHEMMATESIDVVVVLH